MGTEVKNSSPFEPDDVRAYLLNRLDDDEQMRQIEEKLLTDDSFAESLSIVEDELIEDYLDENLSGDERSSFENVARLSDEIRHKINLIRNLRRYSAVNFQTEVAEPSKRRSWLDGSNWFARPLPWVAAAAVALLALGTFVWWRSADASDIRAGISELRAAYKGKRPTESRTSADFDYAPRLVTRGPESKSPADPDALRKANVSLLSASVSDPESAEAHHALGLFHLAQGEIDKALGEFNQAVRLSAQPDAKLQTDLGSALYEKAEALNARGANAEALQNYALALDATDRALAIDDSGKEALFNRALILQKMGHVNKAQEAWNRFLQKDSTSGWADEARENLENLKNSSGGARGKDQVLEDFLDAFGKQDKGIAWAIASESKEMISGVMVQSQLVDRLLKSGALDEQKRLISALAFLGDLELENAGDPYFSELAAYYKKVDTEQRRQLSDANRDMQRGYGSILATKWGDAIESFSRARDRYLRAGDRWEAKVAEYQISFALSQSHRLRESNTRLLALLESSERDQHKWLQALAEGWIGSNYSILGEHSNAIYFDIRSLETASRISDPYNIQRAADQLCHEYYLLGDQQNTFETLNRILEVRPSYFQSDRQASRNLIYAAQAFYRFKFYAAAEASASEQLFIAREKLKDPWMTHTALTNLAQIHKRTGDVSAALAEIDASFAAADSIQDADTRGRLRTRSRLVQAHVQRESSQCTEAIENYNQVISDYEGSGFLINNYDAHKGRLLCYEQLNDFPSMSRELSEVTAIFEEHRESIREEEERNVFFENEQDVYDIAIEHAYSHDRNAEEAFAFAEQSRARSLLTTLSDDRRETLALAAVREQIPQQVQLLYYAVLPDKVLIWCISNERYLAAETAVSSDVLDDKIRQYNDTIAQREFDPEKGKELYKLLVAPVRNDLDANRTLCVVADKSLFQLSFASLVSPDNGQFLIEQFPILYSPSATIFVRESAAANAKPVEAAETLLAIGNPAFRRSEDSNLPNLDDATAEVADVGRQYRFTEPLLENAATKDAVVSSLDSYDVMHFAGHYVSNRKTPADSKMLLAEGDLTIGEISAAKFHRLRLVVLSACDSGVEGHYRGEGMIGAARAFLGAGVPLVIGTVWSVDSGASKELMTAFHRYRKERGMRSVEALRRSQLDMIRQDGGPYHSPYFWAGFAPIGAYTAF
jgi:CHAT domain-containing protein/Tfp pilus assembly protein PilF